MWEVLHVDVFELDASGASKPIGVTEISCGEMIVNFDSTPHDYPFEGMEGAFISLSVDKVVELQKNVLQRSLTVLTATERKSSVADGHE